MWMCADEVVDYNREAFERELAEYDFALDCTGEVRRHPPQSLMVIVVRPSSRAVVCLLTSVSVCVFQYHHRASSASSV